MARIYLDNQATTPIDDRVLEAMLSAGYGNPHSNQHATGWEASAKVERARGQVAALIGADSDEIFFTSGATEANNLAILGVRKLRAYGKTTVLRSSIEHKSVIGACDALVDEFGFKLVELPVEADGGVTPSVLRSATDSETALISIALVNNEIGVIQDIAALAKERGEALFHCDAVQGPEAVDMSSMAAACDLLSLSAHKMRGPMGVGALYIARSVQSMIAPILFGGGQQSGIRPGTLPLPLCVGMGMACEIARGSEGERSRVGALRDRFLAALRKEGLPFQLNGVQDLSRRHPGNANILVRGADAEQLLATLQPGLSASTGSACTSGTLEPSHVLMSIGLSEEQASSSIRFSVGQASTEEDVDRAAVAVAEAYSRLV